MSTTETAVVPMVGKCFICGGEVEGDLQDHFSKEHQRASVKPTTSIKTSDQRLSDIGEAIAEVRQESDTTVQIQRVDQVITELYLVRSSLNQAKRRAAQVQEG